MWMGFMLTRILAFTHACMHAPSRPSIQAAVRFILSDFYSILLRCLTVCLHVRTIKALYPGSSLDIWG